MIKLYWKKKENLIICRIIENKGGKEKMSKKKMRQIKK